MKCYWCYIPFKCKLLNFWKTVPDIDSQAKASCNTYFYTLFNHDRLPAMDLIWFITPTDLGHVREFLLQIIQESSTRSFVLFLVKHFNTIEQHQQAVALINYINVNVARSSVTCMMDVSFTFFFSSVTLALDVLMLGWVLVGLQVCVCNACYFLHFKWTAGVDAPIPTDFNLSKCRTHVREIQKLSS